MRIGEVFKTERRQLVLPEDVAYSQNFVLVRIEEPKTRARGAKHQAAKIEAEDLVKVIVLAFAALPPTEELFGQCRRRHLESALMFCCNVLGPPLLLPTLGPLIWGRSDREELRTFCSRQRTRS